MKHLKEAKHILESDAELDKKCIEGVIQITKGEIR